MQITQLLAGAVDLPGVGPGPGDGDARTVRVQDRLLQYWLAGPFHQGVGGVQERGPLEGEGEGAAVGRCVFSGQVPLEEGADGFDGIAPGLDGLPCPVVLDHRAEAVGLDQ